jgi:hypothetical protein
VTLLAQLRQAARRRRSHEAAEVTASLVVAGLDRRLLGADKPPAGDHKPRSQAATIVSSGSLKGS